MKKSPKKTAGKILFQKHWKRVSSIFDDWLDGKAEVGEFPPFKPWLMSAQEWTDLLEFEKIQYG